MPHKRSRTGCQTCRQDGYKCDEERPYCKRCVRLGKQCPGYGLQIKWRPVNPKRPRAKSAKASESQKTANVKSEYASPTGGQLVLYQRHAANYWKPASPASIDQMPQISLMDKRLLNHWTTILAPMISMTTVLSDNPFLSHLTPLTFEFPALRSAVLSMAASHMASLDPSEAFIEVVSRRHRLASISSLRAMVGSGASQPEVSLATILALQLSDRLFITADDSPADHLIGAKAIIQQQPGRLSESNLGKFLLGAFLYQDILASVTRGSSPLLNVEQGIAVEGLGRLKGLTDVLRVVGNISRMRDMDETSVLEYGAALQETIASLESPVAPQDDIALTVEAYRHAASIYLYRVTHNIGAPHPLTMEHVDACLGLLARVPTTSAILSAHVWPIWTAGCESISVEHRDFVRMRLGDMYQQRRIPSLRRLQSDVEEVWRVKDDERGSTGMDKVDCIKTILQSYRRTADLI